MVRMPSTYVDYRVSVATVGTVLKYIGVAPLFPLLLALYYGEDPVPFRPVPFFVTSFVMLGVGALLEQVHSGGELCNREAFLLVSLAWLVIPLTGTIPYLVAGTGTIRDVFVTMFLALFALSTVLLYLDSYWTPAVTLSGLDAMSVAIATLGNVGPGFGVVGPMNSFEPFSGVSKLYMIFLMWIGRLEVLSVLVIFTPSFWLR